MFDLSTITRIQSAIIARSIPEPNSGCWLWATTLDEDGYGRIDLRPLLKTRSTRAHRLSYIAFVGAIAPGLEIDHLCRIRCCVNPQHLEAVTKKVNSLRSNSFAAINAAKTECVNGHPLTGYNLIIRAGGRGRDCRICMNAQQRAYQKRKRGA